MSGDFYSKYAIKKQLGEGTFSDVLLCKKISTGQLLAVKKLKKEFRNSSEISKLPELIVLKKLSPHPNVLSLIDYIYDLKERKLFMVFERMDKTLYDLIKTNRRPVSENKVKQLIYQVLKGVDHLHANGLFHRDIKPENILINDRPRVPELKLADLGSVRGTHSDRPYTEYISTRWYRAPECMLTAGHYDCKMDIWACGCVYFEMLSSKPIFPGANEIDQLTKIHQVTGTPSRRVLSKMQKLRTDIRFVSYPCINIIEILPFTSDAGRELLKRMLTYDPDVRPNVRRLLEHRYFNDLREGEKTTRIVQSRSCNPLSLSHAITVKPRLQLKQSKTKREKPDDKSSKTWAPSTKTEKVVIQQNKCKPVDVQFVLAKKKPALKLPPVKHYPGSKLPVPIIKEEKPIKKDFASKIPIPITKEGERKCNVSSTVYSLDNKKYFGVKRPVRDVSKLNHVGGNKCILPLIHK